jgi:hypothetical protein
VLAVHPARELVAELSVVIAGESAAAIVVSSQASVPSAAGASVGITYTADWSDSSGSPSAMSCLQHR